MSEKGKLPAGYKAHDARVFFSSNPSPQAIQKAKLTSRDHFFLFVLLALGVLVRLYRVPLPEQVIFDEVHSAGFVHHYANGKFFVDVHPPLVKLVYYKLALLFGYDKQLWVSHIGQSYDNFPYVPLRMFSGLCGLFSVVFAYLALRANFCRPLTAAFGAFLILIESSFVTVSRVMMLDGPLLCAMAFTMWVFGQFRLSPHFSWSWYKYIFLTGVGLGLTTSIKASGVFFFAWIAVLAAGQFWTILGDLEVKNVQVFKHIVLRVFYLVLIPFVIYSSIFAVHFNALPNDGPGAGIMSPNFKASLADNKKFRDMPVDVGYGSTITLKHVNLESYLHSHKYKYRSGNKLQQVTLFGVHTDFNNEWELHHKTNLRSEKLYGEFQPVKNGDVVRIFHKNTKQYLRVDNVRPPITERDYANQVACNETTLGDINYEFKVKIIDQKPHSPNNKSLSNLRATESVFQLFHQGTKCTLLSHQVKLPKWAFEQNEVMCYNDPTMPNTLWYVEYNKHPALAKDPQAEKVHLGGYPFYKKFIEYHRAMWTSNKGLTNAHAYASSPETWPLTLQGINFYTNNPNGSALVSEGSHIFLLGNIAIYALTLLAIVLIGVKQVLHFINYLNPFSLVNETADVAMFYRTTLEGIIGFFFHYTPYFYMERQRFLHHYLGALFIGITLIAYFVEYQTSRRKYVGYMFMVSIVWMSVWTFVRYMPLVYGTPWTRESCEQSKIFSDWNYDCLSYPA